MYTYFILATEPEIARMRSEDDVLDHIEKSEPMVGGRFSLEALASLSKVLFNERRQPTPTRFSFADGSRFYIATKLCEKIAIAEYESLMDASVSWSDEPPWKDSDINPFDLAGFLVEMSILCKQTNSEKSVFILLLNEDADDIFKQNSESLDFDDIKPTLPFRISCTKYGPRLYQLSDGRFQIVEKGKDLAPLMLGYGYILAEAPFANFLETLDLPEFEIIEAVIYDPVEQHEDRTYKQLRIHQEFSAKMINDLDLDGEQIFLMNNRDLFVSPLLKSRLENSPFDYFRFSEGLSLFAS